MIWKNYYVKLKKKKQLHELIVYVWENTSKDVAK